ncbi:maleylacetoacetate isomerase [Pantoea sp. Tr-811]|uniref:maleylacetoacetate isomerase n=1 Tax=Pantoea sp. Tr-811 TaxID=2608361 RepID=UPI00141FB958|nr:maleylacetoacetate isomerase [Pantoea sp. Tr-811]
MKLYGYYRSTSSYRVRIALALKGLAYEYVPVNLLRAEHKDTAFLEMNPQGRVPLLEDHVQLIAQSPAILEYLEVQYPEIALLSNDDFTRAEQRAVASLIACDIHPLHNVAVLNQLRELGQTEEGINRWIGKWISEGLAAIEQMIGDEGFCFGPPPSLADVYLIPQLYAAGRFGISLDAFPKIRRVQGLAEAMKAFRIAHPDAQPDHPAAVL